MSEPLLPTIETPADIQQLSEPQLEQLARELRESICNQVAETGGHLTPNLGVIELTLALHRAFDFSRDRLLFDVGHQSYPHKLLTGRQGLFPKLRQRGGMGGFPDPAESPFDLFRVGHAGTAISTAVGMARGDALRGEGDRRTVALVGDSSIVNGVAMEGLNNAGTLRRQLLIVLNDNGMSINQPAGALASYFDRVRVSRSYGAFKRRARDLLENVPGGEALEDAYHRLGEMAKAALAQDHMFEHFGLLCVGPIDGHDIGDLLPMLEELKDVERPVLLHVKTTKGKGFDFSSEDPTKFHSPKPFSVQGCKVEVQGGGRAYTEAFSDALGDAMEGDERIAAITAGMPDGVGLVDILDRFPERAHDVGIGESHATDMAAGMAKTGLKPVAAIYSTFLQRAFDQVYQEVALHGLPVRFCLDRAGLVGSEAPMHNGFLDIAYLRLFPGMVLCAPIDEPTLREALAFMLRHEAGPSATRYPRDKVPAPVSGEQPPPFELGRANRLARGDQLAILAYGTPAGAALEASRELEEEGCSIAVYDARFAKPVDTALLRSLAESNTPILTVEDHALAGGFGSAVLEAIHDEGLVPPAVRRLGIPDRFIPHASRSEQLAEVGIDQAGIARAAREILESPAGARHVAVTAGK